jgi:hypothetical protein
LEYPDEVIKTSKPYKIRTLYDEERIAEEDMPGGKFGHVN